MALGLPPAGGAEQHTTPQMQLAARKIEAIGFQVGARLVERYTRDLPRFADTLEIIKFICKDLWMQVYRKIIDKLQTNNRGVYMLQDHSHPALTRCSPSASRQATAKQVSTLHVKFPAGLIRGALAGLGVVASVSAEVSDLPAAGGGGGGRGAAAPPVPKCQFTIKIQSDRS